VDSLNQVATEGRPHKTRESRPNKEKEVLLYIELFNIIKKVKWMIIFLIKLIRS